MPAPGWQHEEFGDAYFHLSEIARISPETYRRLPDAGDRATAP